MGVLGVGLVDQLEQGRALTHTSSRLGVLNDEADVRLSAVEGLLTGWTLVRVGTAGTLHHIVGQQAFQVLVVHDYRAHIVLKF